MTETIRVASRSILRPRTARRKASTCGFSHLQLSAWAMTASGHSLPIGPTRYVRFGQERKCAKRRKWRDGPERTYAPQQECGSDVLRAACSNEKHDAVNQNWYSRAGLSTRIFLRTAGSGAQVGRRLSARPSPTCHSGVTLEVLPFTPFGCGQLVPHRMRSTLALISVCASGVKWP